jgi:hypothetical protein
MAGIDSNTVLMLSCNGADGSTTFTDKSDSAHTVTAIANAQVDTAEVKFGTGALLLDGVGDHLQIPDSDDWDFGSDDWTIDFWFRPTTLSGTQAIVTQWGDGGGNGSFYLVRQNASISFFYSLNGSSETSTSSTISLDLNEWQHIAVVREGNSLRYFKNGIASGTAPISGTFFNSTRNLNIGAYKDGGQTLQGSLDEIRISKGIARYTADFVPEITEYTSPSAATASWTMFTNIESNDVSLSLANSWEDIDLSTIAPGATAVIMYALHDSFNGGNSAYGFRKKGSIDNDLTFAGDFMYATKIVGVDSNGFIQAKVASTATKLYVAGYSTSATMFTDQVTIPVTGFNASYRNLDVSGSVPAGSANAMLFVKDLFIFTENSDFRPVGSTDSDTGILSINTSASPMVGLDSNREFEAVVSDFAQSLYLTGYDTPQGSTFLVNQIDVTPATPSSSYQTVDVSAYAPGNAVGAILKCHRAEEDNVVVRAVGSTDDLSRPNPTANLNNQIIYNYVALNGAKQFEALVDDGGNFNEIYLVGFLLGASTTESLVDIGTDIRVAGQQESFVDVNADIRVQEGIGAFSNKVKITIDSSKVSSDLFNFPVLVKLDENNFNFSNTLANGHDVLFVADNEVDLLSFEREFHGGVSFNDVTGTGTASASSSFSGAFDPSNAVDDVITSSWLSDGVNPASNEWWMYDFGIGNEKVINQYTIGYNLNVSSALTDWQFEASNTGAFAGEEVVLDSQSGYSFPTSVVQEFPISNGTAYRYYRINVIDSAGGNFVDLSEVELQEALNEAYYWVKIPFISSSVDTEFFLYYNNPSASDASLPEQVWSNNYTAVWHLSEEGDGTVGEFKDSTSNNHDGQGGLGTVSRVPAPVNTGLYKGQQGNDFNNVFIGIQPSTDFDFSGNDFTIEWTTEWNNGTIEPDAFIGSAGTNQWSLQYDNVTNEMKFFYLSSFVAFSWTPNPMINTEYHLALTRDAGTNEWKFYVDGVQTGGTQVLSLALGDTSNFINLMSSTGGSGNMDGILEEMRISNGQVRSSDELFTNACSLKNELIGISPELDSNETLKGISTDIRGRFNLASVDIDTDVRALNQSTVDANTDIRAKHTLALSDIETDIRAVNSEIIDISADIRVVLETQLVDIQADIRASEETTQDVNTDIRATFSTQFTDVETDVRTIAQPVFDLNTDIRVIDQLEVTENINLDIRAQDNSIFVDVPTDVRVKLPDPTLFDLNTDIRVAVLINTSNVVIESIGVEEGYYLCSNPGQVTINMDVTGAVNMQFKTELDTNFSTFEPYADSKIISLTPGDGTKVITVRFEDLNGDNPPDVELELIIDSSTPPSVNIEAFTDETATSQITESVYTNDNDPFFRFKVPTFAIPYAGFSFALDDDPDDILNITLTELVQDGLEVTPATPLPEMTLDIAAGAVYQTGNLLNVDATTLSLSNGGALDRIDLVYVNDSGVPEILQGTEDASPVAPDQPSSTNALAEVYVPAGTSLIANVIITDVRDMYVEINNYVGFDLDVGSHLFKVYAETICGSGSNVAEFELLVANVSPEMGIIEAYDTSAKTFEIFNGICQSLTNTPFFEWDPSPSEPGPMRYYYTTDGTDPNLLSSSTLGTTLILGPFSEGFSTLKVLPVDETTGNKGKIKEFTLLYCTTSSTDDTLVIGGGTTLRQSLKQIHVQSISWDFDSARICRIFQSTEFDDNLPFALGDDISVVHNGETLFTGKLKKINRSIAMNQEGVLYECTGPRGILTECFATTNHPVYGDTAIISFDDVPIQDAVKQITDLAPNVIRKVRNFPTGANVFDEFQGQTIEQVLSSLYLRTKFGWYITPSGELVSVDSTANNPEEAKFGVYGTTVNSLSPQYNVMSSTLQFDATKRYNKAIIEGALRRELRSVSARCTGGDYSVYKANSDFPVVKIINTSVSYRKALGTLAFGDNIGGSLIQTSTTHIFMRLEISENNKITSITREGGLFTGIRISDISTSEFPQGSLGPNNTIRFGREAFSVWWNSGRNNDSTFGITVPVNDFARKRCASVKADVLVETVPLKAEVSVSGTADAIAKTLRIVDTSFQYDEDPDNPIDDTQKMIDFATDKLQSLKDIKINGSIFLDTVDPIWTLDNTVNLVNTAQGSWTSLNAKVVGINFNFDENVTTLELTSEFLK